MSQRTKTNILKIVFLIYSIFNVVGVNAQGENQTIYNFLNREIEIVDDFAGQRITLVKENSKYIIVRDFFASGLPVVETIKYKVEIESDYQIKFSEILESENKNEPNLKRSKEEFKLSLEEGNLYLYLNGIQIMTKE